MAVVTHVCNRQRIEGNAENPHFLLTNTRGDYLALGNPNHSNYDGFFLREEKHYMKILSNIAPLRPTDELTISDHVVRKSSDASQEFHIFEEGLMAQCSGAFLLTLDCKRLYDESDQGRIYDVEHVRPMRTGGGDALSNISLIKVSYTKYADASLQQKLYETHIVVATTMHVELVKEWRQTSYSYDHRRGTQSTPWVYDLLRCNGNGKVAICAASSSAEARRQAINLLIKHTLVHAPTLPTLQQIAWRSLNTLHTKQGIMAGLPWFFQYWSRDELISCGGLIAAREYAAVQQILQKWYGAIRNGRLPAIYPDEGLTSSDAPGWLGKRTLDLLQRLSDENLLHQVPREMLEEWRERTGSLLDAVQLQQGLVYSDTNTTWMDTSYNDDGRKGYRIEIQALYLALFDCHAYLCTVTRTAVDPARAQKARTVHDAVHSMLVVDGRLLDGLHDDGSPDFLVRPNLFIAWYVAPKLFTTQEWIGFFEYAIDRLWLSWGGLASIDRRGPGFHGRYSGESAHSYHRGDSWYYVNNIAALAMRIDERFADKVKAIIDASVADMLWQGYCGHCSEVSSADSQEACGAHSQAWSASTLLELLK